MSNLFFNRDFRSAIKRKQKNEKYGFGGKKRGTKRNTKDSAAGMAPRKLGNLIDLIDGLKIDPVNMQVRAYIR